MPGANIKEWIAGRAEAKRQLYERFGQPFEENHKGDYLAIGPDGRTIVGKRAGDVLRQAIDTFGSGNFGLFRVGHRAFARWLKTDR